MPKLYRVFCVLNGISEHRFTGTKQQCIEWTEHRGDTGKAGYIIEE
jgi:hypothetical protein